MYTGKLDEAKRKQAEEGQDPKSRPAPVEQSTRPGSPLDKLKAEQIKGGINPTAAPVTTEAPGTLAHYQAAIEVDKVKLKDAKTLEEKAAMKRTFLPQYQAFVNEYIEGGHDYPNSVVVQVAIWCFDVADIERGLTIAMVLVGQAEQIMPKGFDRDLQTFICDTVYDWANVQLRAEQSASPYLDDVARAIDRQKWDLHPAVHSKVYVMLAKHKFRQGEYAETVVLCERAQAVNPEGAGVKTLLGQARISLKKL